MKKWHSALRLASIGLALLPIVVATGCSSGSLPSSPQSAPSTDVKARHKHPHVVLVSSPDPVMLHPGANQTVTVSSGPDITLDGSDCAGIATITKTSQSGGTAKFKVTAQSVGTCTVVYTDDNADFGHGAVEVSN